MTQLIKLSEVIKKVGVCRTSIYSKIDRGEFPKQIKLGERSVAWVEEEIDNWIKERIEERDSSN